MGEIISFDTFVQKSLERNGYPPQSLFRHESFFSAGVIPQFYQLASYLESGDMPDEMPWGTMHFMIPDVSQEYVYNNILRNLVTEFPYRKVPRKNTSGKFCGYFLEIDGIMGDDRGLPVVGAVVDDQERVLRIHCLRKERRMMEREVSRRRSVPALTMR